MMMVMKLLCFLSSLFLQILLAADAQSKCNHEAEISALLQFKDGFQINCTGRYGDNLGYPKTSSWNIESLNNNNNASLEWNGVECDPVTGHVIGLDLSSSCLHGSIINSNSSSSIFSHLVHLQHLNLAFNDFNRSSIPSELGNLSRLTYLNLSFSLFAGGVPLEISKLSMLSSLDLSDNYWVSELKLKRLVRNLTNLEELDLTSIAISSEVPDIFTNMSSLRSLKLDNCELYGEFPQGIFHLPNLKHLSIQDNDQLNGYLPDFNWSTSAPLESLLLRGTNFDGRIPASIGNLVSLRELDLGYNKFSGPIPTSLGNLVSLRKLDLGYNKFSGPIPTSLGNLTQLIVLDLSYYNFPSNFNTLSSLSWIGNNKLTNLRDLHINEANLKGEIPSSFGNLPYLSFLALYGNQLSGQIPPPLTNLTQLSVMDLGYNDLTGEIPPGLVNLTKLTHLTLSNNKLQGPLPIRNLRNLEYLDVSNNKLQGPLPIRNLRNLKYLDVSNNNFSGTLELDMFFEFKNLTWLLLSSNNLTLLLQTNSSANRLPRLRYFNLSSCRLSKFPTEFLQNQHELIVVDLSCNNIEGPIPRWTGGVSVQFLNLSHNSITGFVDPHLFLPLTNLYSLDISFNKLQGSIPVPPPLVYDYIASNNQLTGEIPHSLCNSSSLQVLDISSNRLAGELQQYCFGKFSTGLNMLNLRNNSFHGRIPEFEFCTSSEDNSLTMIDLSSNQFQGKIPRSLANCVDLEFFDAGSNLINDTFPSWLGSLPQLKVVILRDNALHGTIGTPKRQDQWFPELRIIDLSRNNLTGKLSSWYFGKWIAMKTTNLTNPSYMGQGLAAFLAPGFYDYSLTMYIKGTEREYLKILDALIAIDLSGNRFEGEIPTIIGDLRGVRFLNLSNNLLSGKIPSPLGDLVELESLDLSANRLSGQIPQQLIQLNSLSFFDVSNNNLSGSIPQGRHFDTFQNTSYNGNPGLCGEPLSRKCGNSGQEAAQPPDEVAEKHDNFWEDFNGEIEWLVVSIGFAGGLTVGVAIECMFDLTNPILSFWWSRNMRRRRQLRRN